MKKYLILTMLLVSTSAFAYNSLADNFSQTFDNEMTARKQGMLTTYKTLYDRSITPAGGVSTADVFEAMGTHGKEKMDYLKALKLFVDTVEPGQITGKYATIPDYTENNDGSLSVIS